MMRHCKSSIVGPPQKKQYFYVSLGNKFLQFFFWRFLSCGGPGQLPSLPPPLKSGPDVKCAIPYGECRQATHLLLARVGGSDVGL